MKAILIVAATLMTGASVYGIVDYNKKTNTREFKELYTKEEKVPVKEEKKEIPAEVRKEPATAEVRKNSLKLSPDKKTTIKKNPKKKKQSKLNFKSFSRASMKG